MAYKRTYTLNEVHDLICACEGRNSPKTGAPGHAIGLHADGRASASDGRSHTVIYLAETIEESRKMDPSEGISVVTPDWSPGQDSRFTTRLDMVKAVCAGLNSAEGQNKLAEFDTSPSKKRVIFSAPVSPAIKNVEKFIKATGDLQRGRTATAVKIIVDRLGASTAGAIHIQTAYPENVS